MNDNPFWPMIVGFLGGVIIGATIIISLEAPASGQSCGFVVNSCEAPRPPKGP